VADGRVFVWEVKGGRRRLTTAALDGHKEPSLMRAVFPAGDARTLATWDGYRLVVRDLATGKVSHERRLAKDLSPGACSPDGKQFALWEDEERMSLHPTAADGGRPVKLALADRITWHSGFAWSPDCRRFALAGLFGEEATVYDTATGKRLATMAFGKE